MLWSVLQELKDTGACKGRPRLCVFVLHCFAFSERLLQPRLGETKREGGTEGEREGGRRAERRAQMLDTLVAQEANSRQAAEADFFLFVMFCERSCCIHCWLLFITLDSTGAAFLKTAYLALRLQPPAESDALSGLQTCLECGREVDTPGWAVANLGELSVPFVTSQTLFSTQAD